MSELLTAQEVARILRVDDTTVRRWAKKGAIRVIVLPHAGTRVVIRIKRKVIDGILGEK
jgi:excisionase family DNA binding protein